MADASWPLCVDPALCLQDSGISHPESSSPPLTGGISATSCPSRISASSPAYAFSTATIILAGIPAAIYEHVVGAKDDSTAASLWIWLAGTGLLTLPAMGNFFQIGL